MFPRVGAYVRRPSDKRQQPPLHLRAAHPGFPGRRFAVDTVTSFNKRQLKEALRDVTSANITVRNFPMTVAVLRKKLKLKDGGNTYIFATTTDGGEHVLLITHKE